MRNKGWIVAAVLLLVAILAFFVWRGQEKKEGNFTKQVGVIAPLTGDNAFYGNLLRNNFDLAFEGQSTVELVYEDSKFDPATSISAFQKLVDFNKVPIVLGEVASGNSIAVAPVAANNKVILFSSISSADELKDAGDYFFRNIPSNDIQGETMAKFIFDNLNIKKVALFGLNDAYGVNISKSFTTTFQDLGGEIVLNENHEKGQKDFRSTLTKIKKSNAEAIFAPGDKNEPALILKQAKELGITIPILSGDGASNEDVINIAGKASEGFYTTNVQVDKSTEFYKKYREKYFDKFMKEPGAYDAYAYEAARIVLEAAINSEEYDSKSLMNYLYSNTFKSMTGKLNFDSHGEVKRLWGVYQVQNGSFVEVQ